MAEALAKRLREEIHVEDLGSLLTDLRALHQVVPHHIYIDPIDELLIPILNPPPPAAPNLFRDGSPAFIEPHPGSIQAPPGQQNIKQKPVKTNPVIEIVTQNTRGGKTQLVHLIAASALLGASTQNAPDLDSGNAVIWIDLDRRLDIVRLHSILSSLIHTNRRNLQSSAPDPSQAQPPPSTDQVPPEDWPPSPAQPNTHTSPSPPQPSPNPTPSNSLPESADRALAASLLAHLHVFRPPSFASLLTTLRSLPATMLATTTHRSGGQPVSHLILTGVTSLYWIERARIEAPGFDTETPPNLDPTDGGGTRTGVDNGTTPTPAPGLGTDDAQRALAVAASTAAMTFASTQVQRPAVPSYTESNDPTSDFKPDADADPVPTPAPASTRAPFAQSITSRYATLHTLLSAVRRQLHCAMVLTRWAGPGAPRLGLSWDGFVDVRLLVGRLARERLPMGISVREALELEERRRLEMEREREVAEREGRKEAQGKKELEQEKEEEGRGEEGKGGNRKEAEEGMRQAWGSRETRFWGTVMVDGKERGKFGFKATKMGVEVWRKVEV